MTSLALSMDMSLAELALPGTLRLVRSRSVSNATKTCTQCGAEKSLGEFYALKAGALGKTARCKQCIRAAQQGFRSTPEGKAWNREQNRKSYAKHRDKRIAEMREYQAKNREALRRQNKEYRRRADVKARKSAYDIARYRDLKSSGYWDVPEVREAKRAAVRRHSATAKAKARQANSSSRNKGRELGRMGYAVTDGEVLAIMQRPCEVCHATELIELDHIIPFARGGAHKVGNLQALCRPCNRAKRDRTMTEFRMWIRRLKAVQ